MLNIIHTSVYVSNATQKHCTLITVLPVYGWLGGLRHKEQ